MEPLTREMLTAMGRLYRTGVQRKLGNASRGELFVLNFLAQGRGQALPGELSAAMEVSSARMAAAVNSLEKKGDVVRVPDETDRRRVRVVLTDAGRRRLDETQTEMWKEMDEILRELGEEDTREFLRIVRRLTAITQARMASHPKTGKPPKGETEC